jgi:hypothetical protein
MEKDEKQIEDPILSQIKKELNSISKENEEILPAPETKKGTNRLLWNTPVYSAVGINLKDNKNENPNEYWQKWAKEQEKLNKNIK